MSAVTEERLRTATADEVAQARTSLAALAESAERLDAQHQAIRQRLIEHTALRDRLALVAALNAEQDADHQRACTECEQMQRDADRLGQQRAQIAQAQELAQAVITRYEQAQARKARIAAVRELAAERVEIGQRIDALLGQLCEQFDALLLNADDMRGTLPTPKPADPLFNQLNALRSAAPLMHAFESAMQDSSKARRSFIECDADFVRPFAQYRE